jgi:tetratricopeptide (TPR) repeat protein
MRHAVGGAGQPAKGCENGCVRSLAEAVLPLIRSRADVWRWSAANAHGAQMHEAIDLLESALPTVDANEAYAVAHKALASSLKVIARADDSSGIIGDACRRLLELHPRLAAAAQVAPSKLVTWMMAFQFDGDVDYFELDPVAYASALGERGMRAYRERLDEVRATLPPAPDSERWTGTHSHERWVLEWNDRRLAVLDRDVDAIIRTHSRDRKVARWYLDTAQALAEIDQIDLAIDWARQATDAGPSHQSLQASEYWCQMLAEYRPDEVLAAREHGFRRMPSATTASRLHAAAGAAWPAYESEVMTRLARDPDDAVNFVRGSLKDPQRAWDLAHELGVTSAHTWGELVKDYETIDPLQTLDIHRELVEATLETTGAQHYRDAARRLARMRKLAKDSDRADEVDSLIAGLREAHRRRPRLQQEFDRAGLP